MQLVELLLEQLQLFFDLCQLGQSLNPFGLVIFFRFKRLPCPVERHPFLFHEMIDDLQLLHILTGVLAGAAGRLPRVDVLELLLPEPQQGDIDREMIRHLLDGVEESLFTELDWFFSFAHNYCINLKKMTFGDAESVLINHSKNSTIREEWQIYFSAVSLFDDIDD